jgi:hypothetical protein
MPMMFLPWKVLFGRKKKREQNNKTRRWKLQEKIRSIKLKKLDLEVSKKECCCYN